MDSRKALDGRAIGFMLALCAVWGFQQVALKAMAADITPIFQIALRSGVAVVLVGIVMLVRRERLTVASGNWRPGLLVALLFGLEFWLVGEGLRYTSAAHMVVFLYTAPIFAALGLHWRLPSERLSPLQWLGIGLAFVGLGFAFFGRGSGSSSAANPALSAMLWGDFLSLMGGLAWGATTVVVRNSRLARAPATETLLYQLVGAFVLLMAVAWSTGQTQVNFTPQVWISLVFQSVVVSFASFLLWFWLLRQYLAAQLGVFSFLTPMFGIVFGALWLGERIETSFLIGAVPLMGGIVLVSGHAWLTQKWRLLVRSKVIKTL